MSDHIAFSVIRNIGRSAKWGVIALCVVNVSAAFTGISLGFGWVSGCTAIGLGAPGVIGLLVLNALFMLG